MGDTWSLNLPVSLLKQELRSRRRPQLTHVEPGFVYDPRPGYDFCYTPKNLLYHGGLSFDFARETVLRPIFQLSKFSRNPEFVTTPLQAYENVTSVAAKQKTMDWGEKTLSKLFWRGSSTGDSYAKKKNGDWRRSHRPRLHLLAQNGNGTDQVLVERSQGWVSETWGREQLNEAYLDIGLIGGPHQVGTAQRYTLTASAKSKMGHAPKWRRRLSSKKGSDRRNQTSTNASTWSLRKGDLLTT